jgi:hypothetical protein
MNQFTIQELSNRPEVVVHYNEEWSKIRIVVDGAPEIVSHIDSIGYGWLSRDAPNLSPLLVGTITAYIVREWMRNRIIDRVVSVIEAVR